jgi:hypothetical protein
MIKFQTLNDYGYESAALEPKNSHPSRRLGSVCACLLLLVSLAPGQPKQNVRPGKHPNLAAAQRLSENAYNKIIAAQQANEWDMQGHAQKAKTLLEQANVELKAAAQAANKNTK